MSADILSRKEWENEIFEGIEVLNGDLSGWRFEECEFMDCQLIDTILRRAAFTNCSFTRCNLSNLPANNCIWGEVLFTECKLVGIDFSNCKKLIFSVRLDSCQLTMCNFSMLKMQETIFSKSEIRDCDFFESELQEANFSGCDLRGSLFESSDLRKADFTDATNYSIDPTKNKLKQARFSLPEALSLLDFLEVEIN